MSFSRKFLSELSKGCPRRYSSKDQENIHFDTHKWDVMFYFFLLLAPHLL